MQPFDLETLKSKILDIPISSKRSTYTCSFADDNCLIFEATSGTGKTMIPTDLAREWIMAYESGRITLEDSAAQMNVKVKECSDWSKYHHGHTTHLSAIVKAWADE